MAISLLVMIASYYWLKINYYSLVIINSIKKEDEKRGNDLRSPFKYVPFVHIYLIKFRC